MLHLLVAQLSKLRGNVRKFGNLRHFIDHHAELLRFREHIRPAP